MTGKQYVVRSNRIAARALDGKMMIISPVNSMLFVLDVAATVIWESADGTTLLEDIVANKICTRFDVTPQVALQDAEKLVEDLAEHELLFLSDQPVTEASGAGRESGRAV
jgi:hypothetical protein